jgi:hypothetical protein
MTTKKELAFWLRGEAHDAYDHDDETFVPSVLALAERLDREDDAPACDRCGTVDEARVGVTLCGDCMPEPVRREPVERKPVAGWVWSEAHPFDWYLTVEAGDRTKITVSAFGDDRGEGAGNRFFRIECDDESTDGSVALVNDRYGHETDEALLFAAEDALFAIADAINALRCRP